MKRKALIAGLVVLLGLAVVGYYWAGKYQKTPTLVVGGAVIPNTTGMPVEEKIRARTMSAPYVPLGEFVINANSPQRYDFLAHPGSLQSATINGLEVKELSIGKTKVQGKEVNQMWLTVGFEYQGKPVTMKVAMLDGVNCSHCVDEEPVMSSVDDLKLVVGDRIALVLTWVPVTKGLTAEGVADFCEFSASDNCWFAWEQGLGSLPVTLS